MFCIKEVNRITYSHFLSNMLLSVLLLLMYLQKLILIIIINSCALYFCLFSIPIFKISKLMEEFEARNILPIAVGNDSGEKEKQKPKRKIGH